MSTDRPAFRPNRARASLGVLPTHSTLTLPNKENGPSTSLTSTSTSTTQQQQQQQRKKRAQSLGGDALENLRKRTKVQELQQSESTTLTFELSPSRAERRKAAPRRSILKQTPAVFENNTINFTSHSHATATTVALANSNHTTDLSSLHTFQSKSSRRRSSIKPTEPSYDDSDEEEEEDDDDPNGSLDMDITRMDVTAAYDREGRRTYRASHSRRVSFAPAASVRNFTPDKPTGHAQSVAAARAAAQAAALAAAELSGDTSIASIVTSQGEESSSEEEEDEGDEDMYSEPSMEIAGDEVTLAFKGHFAGTQLPISAVVQPSSVDQEDDEEGSSSDEGERVGGAGGDEDGTQAMEEVTQDLTGNGSMWGQTTGVFNSQAQPSVSTSRSLGGAAESTPASLAFELHGSRKTTNDEETNKEVDDSNSGKEGGGRPRFSMVAREEDDEDEEIMRSLGFAKGGKPRKSRIAFDTVGEEDEEDEDEEGSDMEQEEDDETAAMEMTTVVGGLVNSTQSAHEESDDDDAAEEAEVSMQLIGGSSNETTSNYDSVNQPQSTTTTTTMNARPSLGAMLSVPLPRPSLAPSPSNDRLSSPVRARSASPAKSPAHPSVLRQGHASPGGASSRAISVPLGPSGSIGTPSKSPFRKSYGYGSGSARQSSPLPSPRRIALASPAPPPIPTSATTSSSTIAGIPSTTRSRSRSASPVKFAPPSSLASKSPRKSLSSLHPDVSTGATPNRSSSSSSTTVQASSTQSRRSISPVKKAANHDNNEKKKVIARPSLAPTRSPGGSLSLKGLMAAQQGGGCEAGDLDVDDSFERHETPRHLTSIEEFFAATGTEFMNISGTMKGGLDLNESRVRRKSLAASKLHGERVPPTFADMAVAGACQAHFYHLYRGEQKRLREGLEEVEALEDEIVKSITGGFLPDIFIDWPTASDEEKALMKTQFAQIKLNKTLQGQVEWKKIRNQNLDFIVSATEENLELLKSDREALSDYAFEAVIPSLEERRAALQADLMLERTLDDELSHYNDDQREELEQLHAAIEEQDEQINGNRNQGILGARPQFERIEQQLQKDRTVLETEREKEQAAKERIVQLESALKDKRTKADLSRLQAEYEALQHLHGWSLTHFSATKIELRHFDEVDVAFDLERSLEIADCQLAHAVDRQTSSSLSHDVTVFLVKRMAEQVTDRLRDGPRDLRSMIRFISNMFLIARHIRQEISLASLDYPVRFNPTNQTLHLEVYSSKARKAFEVVVAMNDLELDARGDKTRWAEHLSAEVQVKFGGNIGTAGIDINERLNDCEGLVAAIRAGEASCAIAV